MGEKTLLWKEKKNVEFSIHTKYCTLDGVSSTLDYLASGQRKGYSAFAITDFNTVQAFPDAYNSRKNFDGDLKILYGCEFEMIEEKFPAFFRDRNSLLKEKEIVDLTYCILDIETTGLFSNYDEIIELGYVIIKNNKVIKESNFLIKPKSGYVPTIIEKITGINPEQLIDSPSIEEVLTKVNEEWIANNVEVLVSHNAINFDIPFISKFWELTFNKKINYPIIDTLILSRLVFPDKRSHSLEKLSNFSKKKKLEQTHRALDDSLLLKSLFEKFFKYAKEKQFKFWEHFESLIGKKFYFRGIGTKVKIIAKNQKGLSDLYKLVKISQVDNFFKAPFLFRSDIEKIGRDNIIVGSSGDIEGEVYSSFTSFGQLERVSERIKFYDYVEVPLFDCFSHLLATERIKKDNLQTLLFSVITESRNNNVLAISVGNVYYAEINQRKIQEILIANEGVNGKPHRLYSYANNKFLGDKFESLPAQHLREGSEIDNNWSFLTERSIVEEIVYTNPQRIVDSVSEIEILEESVKYLISDQKELDLVSSCTKKILAIFPKWNVPQFALQRMWDEWKIIKNKEYLLIYWLSWKVVSKAQEGGNIVGSRGSVGCSFIAYLLGITDINPLPLYTICKSCSFVKKVVIPEKKTPPSCYDFTESENCAECKEGVLRYEGHSLPFETFVGVNGEKKPDIDLNFSSSYQKVAHQHLREILGKENVYKIGTISKISQQTAEAFWNGHLSLRKEIDPSFNLEIWARDFVDEYKELMGIDKFEFIDPKSIMIEKLRGIKRTTGQHPGGLLVIPAERNIIDFTPVNYPADDHESDWLTTHFDYEHLNLKLLKIDILANHQSETLEGYSKTTGKDALDQEVVSFSDHKIMRIFSECDTLGIPEFGTDFVKKSFLAQITPNKFSELVKISGFSHGTSVWMGNQQQVHKEKRLKVSELVACREDILDLLNSKGVEKGRAFVASEFIRKGKWAKLDSEIKQELEEKLTGDEGKIYFSILSKIEYIFPKPHAIAYTMAAWRTAYYKAYFPQVFYANLLTYHAVVHDIWLMTLDVENSIPFKLEKLISSLDSLKNAKKEFISICKVLLRLSRENSEIEDFVKDTLSFNSQGTFESHYQQLGIDQNATDNDLQELRLKIREKLNLLREEETQKTTTTKRKRELVNEIQLIEKSFRIISNPHKRKIYDQRISLRNKIFEKFSRRELNDWVLTMKEKELLFTLKVINEFKKKGFDFSIGFDFNNSDATLFKFVDNKILIPFSVISSVGPKVTEKISSFRELNNGINDWKKDLEQVINKKVFEQFLDLENNGLVLDNNNLKLNTLLRKC